MDIVTVAKTIQAEIDRQFNELESQRSDLSRRESVIKLAEKTNANQDGELNKREAEIAMREQAIDDIDAIREREEQLHRDEISIKLEKTRLEKYESELAEINERLKAEKEALLKAQKELSEEKETYKETLKSEFLEELKKNLPA